APPAAAGKPHAVGGSAAGWTAAGGLPVVVAQGETLDSLSERYGVPAAALLSANGLSSASEVKSGMKMIVPVYNGAGGKAVAEAGAAKRSKTRPQEVAENAGKDAPKSKKTKAEEKAAESKKTKAEKAAEAKNAKAEEKAAEAKKSEERTADRSMATDKPKAPDKSEIGAKPAAVAKTEATRAAAKKPAADDSSTAAAGSKAGEAKSSTQADASSATPEFRWPARGRIIGGFKAGGNDGINISVPEGTSVRAAENGVVVYAGDGLKGYGNLVLIKHPNGFVTAYANNAEIEVKKGETVKRGQIIAKSGDTGNVNSPQLHFELRKGATPVDPTQYLAGL
ncbi:MAG: LysM peptidoglycan-binding domain-containing M23 family metallopeptidase, partial [Hyphomicrobiales bacterium]|nr:LysM peptidoglycan-binding domain-containing M23 family metallopeptidase [Hyphomicrobiales bacterium]